MKYTPSAAAILANRFLAPGDTVLEIGAADGAHTAIYAQRVGPSGRVVAVEPNRAQHSRLRRLGPQVSVWDGAVSDAHGQAPFYAMQTPTASTLIQALSYGPAQSYLVEVTTVDALVQMLPAVPALIHVDAQGSEAAILQGARRMLTIPAVWVIELWPAGLRAAGDTVEDVLQPLESQGYVPHDVRGREMAWQKVRDEAEKRKLRSYGDVVFVPAEMLVAA